MTYQLHHDVQGPRICGQIFLHLRKLVPVQFHLHLLGRQWQGVARVSLEARTREKQPQQPVLLVVEPLFAWQQYASWCGLILIISKLSQDYSSSMSGM